MPAADAATGQAPPAARIDNTVARTTLAAPTILGRWSFSRTGERAGIAHRIQQSRYAFRGLACKRFGNSDLLSDLELAAEELFVNAAEHGDGPTVTVSLVVCENTLRVDVHDGGTAPIGKPDGDELAETGRGWFLVRAFTDRSGIDQDERGTTAWFEMRLP